MRLRLSSETFSRGNREVDPIVPKRRIHWQAKTCDPKNPRHPCCLIATTPRDLPQRISRAAMGIIHSVSVARRAANEAAEKWAQTTACRKNSAETGASTQTAADDRPRASVSSAGGRHCGFGQPDAAAQAGIASNRSPECPLAAPSTGAAGRRVGDLGRVARRHRVALGRAAVADPDGGDCDRIVPGRSSWCTGTGAPARPRACGVCLALAIQGTGKPAGGDSRNSVDGKPVQLHGRE